jgi:Fic family protein
VGTLVPQQWPGNPAGYTPKARRSGPFQAYVPGLLADLDLHLPATLADAVTDVTRQLDTLNSGQPGLGQLEPMARFLLRAEAVASSWMEGLTIGARRLARAEAAASAEFEINDDTAQAVLGNIYAIEEALKVASDPARPVTVQDMCAIHAAVLARTRDAKWGGVLRADQNWIGGTSPLDAEYVPPPAAMVGPLMEDLAAYLTASEHPALVQAAVAHAQFETIHPFADGNGRAGRALILLVLRRRGVAPTVVPPVSLVLATRARAYIAALVGVRETDGSRQGLLDWVDLFVDATGRACGDTQDFAATLAVWDSQMRARAGRLRAGSAAASIVDALPALPVFTAGTMAQYLSRPPQKINEAIARLVQADVIRQVNVGKRRNRAFEAIDLFDRFTDFERGLAIDEEHGNRPARPVPAH